MLTGGQRCRALLRVVPSYDFIPQDKGEQTPAPPVPPALDPARTGLRPDVIRVNRCHKFIYKRLAQIILGIQTAA